MAKRTIRKTGPDGLLLKQPETAEEVLEWLRASGSDRMTFSVKRPPEPGRSVSLDALNELNQQVQTFISARIMDHWDRRTDDAPGPSEVVVGVSITIDGETFIVTPDKVPFFEIDGALRN